MKYLDKKEGRIFFIPLFLPEDIKSSIKSFSKYKFETEKLYAFGRLIEPSSTNGDLIEIFNYIGSIPKNPEKIIKSGLISYPLHASLAFKNKRWRFIFDDKDYEKNRDSNYNSLEFLLGDYDNPELWIGGKNTGRISIEDAKEKKHWEIFIPTKIERKIREVMAQQS